MSSLKNWTCGAARLGNSPVSLSGSSYDVTRLYSTITPTNFPTYCKRKFCWLKILLTFLAKPFDCSYNQTDFIIKLRFLLWYIISTLTWSVLHTAEISHAAVHKCHKTIRSFDYVLDIFLISPYYAQLVSYLRSPILYVSIGDLETSMILDRFKITYII